MNLDQYRNSDKEQLRINSLMGLVPYNSRCALDVGARDGYLSKKLTDYFDTVTAVDLEIPKIEHKKVISQKGDITHLDFLDSVFDLVLCAEVLEHIPTKNLVQACSELCRVTKNYLIIGVPYNQDLRFGRTTCNSCKQKNPPWGHVNSFNLKNIEALFPLMKIEKIEYVGASKFKTNCISTFLMDLVGNPYGTYAQEEGCIHCGQKILAPLERNLTQKILTRIAHNINVVQQFFTIEQANWIHVLLKK